MSVGLPFLLLAGAGLHFHVSSLLAYITYAWRANGLRAGTIAGHLAADKLFHRQERGFELFLRPLVDSRCVKGSHSLSRRGWDHVAYT